MMDGDEELLQVIVIGKLCQIATQFLNLRLEVGYVMFFHVFISFDWAQLGEMPVGGRTGYWLQRSSDSRARFVSLNFIHVTCYTVPLYVVDFKRVPNFGEAEVLSTSCFARTASETAAAASSKRFTATQGSARDF
jgi:hypothetical protein